MAKSLQEILHFRALTGLIQGVKGGVPGDWLDPGLLGNLNPIKGIDASYTKVESTRQVAELVHYGNPSVARSLSGVTEVPVRLLHTMMNHVYKQEILQKLRNYDNPDVQAMGQAEVDRMSTEFSTLFRNLRISTVASMLRFGAIYFNGRFLLPSASGATITIDFQVPANNKDQLNGIIATKWDDTSAKIQQQITNLKKTAMQTSGYPLTTAYYGSAIWDFLNKNTTFKSLLTASSGFNAEFQQGEIPDGYMGLRWKPAYQAFFVDSGGTTREWFPEDFVVFTPDVSPEWFETLEGSYSVPTDIGVVERGEGSAVAALGNLADINGGFSYATMINDPVSIKQVSGDTFLPVLKVPAAIYIADTSF